MGQESTATGSNSSSGTRSSSQIESKFFFECDHIRMFCTNLQRHDIVDHTDSLLEVKLEDLDNRWNRLQGAFEELMIVSETDGCVEVVTKAQSDYTSSSEAYYSARASIMDILRLTQASHHPNVTLRRSRPTTGSLDSRFLSHPVNDGVDNCIKVPPCDTEIFKGGYEEWPSFRDMFTAVYVNHPRLTQAQKLYHLRNKTRGSAGAIVKRYALCDDNFDLAWKALRDRFENRRVLVDNQLKILFNIPSANVETSESIQKVQSTVRDCLATLKALSVNTEGWDPILIYLISTKLPEETLSQWEQSLKSHRELPMWDQMDSFLVDRFEVVERIRNIRDTKERYGFPSGQNSKVQTYYSQENLSIECRLCSSNHCIRTCQAFRRLTVPERIKFVLDNDYCNNCLSSNHTRSECKSKSTCLTCRKKHHTLLHLQQKPLARKYQGNFKAQSPAEAVVSPHEENSNSVEQVCSNQPSTSGGNTNIQVQANFSTGSEEILLRTALVQIEHEGNFFTIRALIDPGSQRTFLSEKVRSRLRIPYQRSNYEIVGIGEQTQSATKQCQLKLFSSKYNISCDIMAIILPKLTRRIPAVSFEIPSPNNLQDLDLADPKFNKSSQIDIILGNDSERFINIDGIRKNVCGESSAYNTIFGWVLSGPMTTQVHSFSTSVRTSEDSVLADILRKFWELEEIPNSSPLSDEDQYCENYYRSTTVRLDNGRYMRELISTILNWRKYKFVFGGDIQKMYRQIMVHPEDRPYQRILFRQNGSINDFQLKTVTFGINCAPFLAIRTLVQLASDSEVQYPKSASILRNETYVDDILSGGYTIDGTREAQSQLISCLQSAGFILRKITANDPQLLTHLPSEYLYDSDFLKFSETSTTKTLGIKWNAISDTFSYAFSFEISPSKVTKRSILSAVAQLFDPAGWITPVIIQAKILMQQLWLEGLQWDEEVGSDTLEKWNSIIAHLPLIEDISIPRWIQYMPSDTIQIHGFSDSSKLAYCACVYIRCQTSEYVVLSNLLVAKSKVAPIKPVSLPRLELNGAVLLAKLVRYVISSLSIPHKDIILWTDSSIVLGWLSKPPWTWETYIANRTAMIHDLLPNFTWRHIATHDNPADLGTRGCRPQDLKNSQLWWHGPSWLTNPISSWPKKNPLETPVLGKRVQSLHTLSPDPDILERFSSFNRALRVLSYVFRFLHNSHKNFQSPVKSKSLNLSQAEVNFVKIRLIALSQERHYKDEIKLIRKNQPIPNKSSLCPLNPFMDSNGILRVNGRLANSFLPYRERYPIILPGNSLYSHLYLSELHKFLGHGEISIMTRMVQTEYHISRLKSRIKNVIFKCKICTIHKHKASFQIMAPLPPERCAITPPFHVTGIDFAGPFEIKSSFLRKAPTLKAYVCVFVCFSTKATHLELCSDLSSAAFEAAFARFVGRRGLPHKVMSDNGRNFLGTSRTLSREFARFHKCISNDISQKYVSHGFEWCFIPPHAPHMGGLWEAAVKSFKFHFRRIAGAHKFTFEQMATLLARIEGLLNSRPISALSEDPSDINALTPGHFLKGAPLVSLPEPISQNLSLINRWEKLKAMHHQFSLRWKEDYLKSLQKRYKWKTTTPNIKNDDLVVVMDDLLPPNEWRLGRVQKTFMGSDNNVRVAEIRLSTGTITRPIVKLCVLPYHNDGSTNHL
ncbi:uncharacterized protein LOC142235484 [Haematobia irritans]|uniref:uncharacterized protein LOC142235484 n=1 Tax=Haematobia irritans TaxID=7368 RepID=UPI003F50541C